MTWFAVVVAALAVLCLLVWLWDRAPMSGVAQVDLPRFLEALLLRGYQGGFLVVRPRRRREFIQFSKYIGQRGAGLQFDFPRAPWSKPYYERIQALLERHGFDFDRQAVSNGAVSEFLTVDLGQDLLRAASLSRLCLEDLFGCDAEEPLSLLMRNVSARDERIGI